MKIKYRRRRKNDAAPPRAKRGRRSGSLKATIGRVTGLSRRPVSFIPMSAEEAAVAPRRRARGAKKAAKARKAKAKGRGSARRIKLARQIVGMRLVTSGRAPGAGAGTVMGVVRRGKRKGQSRAIAQSARWYAARRLSKKDMTKGSRAIGSAWKAARKAQSLAHSPLEKAQLRAMGLAAIPNRSMVGPLKDLGALLPTIGVGVASVVGIALAGHKLGESLAKSLPASLAPHAPAIASGGLAILGYMLARNVKALAKYSLPILLGGVAATTVQLLRSIKVKDAAGTADISLANKLGLPLGEYTAMGEYTHMGDRSARPGHADDDPNFVNGLDDEPDFAPGEEIEDDEIGGIFDQRIF